LREHFIIASYINVIVIDNVDDKPLEKAALFWGERKQVF
jgi:hypothetical protein